MSKFKVGDTVRCLKSYGSQFTKDNLYVVTEVIDGGTFPRLSFAKDDLGSTSNGWLQEFFEPVANTGSFIVVRFDGNTPSASCIPHIHLTKSAAEAEAERLARQVPTAAFYVFERGVGFKASVSAERV